MVVQRECPGTIPACPPSPGIEQVQRRFTAADFVGIAAGVASFPVGTFPPNALFLGSGVELVEQAQGGGISALLARGGTSNIVGVVDGVLFDSGIWSDPGSAAPASVLNNLADAAQAGNRAVQGGAIGGGTATTLSNGDLTVTFDTSSGPDLEDITDFDCIVTYYFIAVP